MNHEERLALAPCDLTYARPTRYDGAGFSVPQSRFAHADIELLTRVYRVMRRAHGLWLHLRDASRIGAPLHIDLLRRHILRELRDRRFLLTLRDLGAATYELGTPPHEVRGALHDVRGGALLALIGFAAAEARGEEISDGEIRHAALRARDHARIMRHAVIDLDPQLREIDAEIKTHTILDFVDKWDMSIYRAGERQVVVSADVAFDGMVAHHDLETAALDRVLYNHVNNAAHYTADDRVSIAALPINDHLVRWVVENPLNPDHNLALREATGGDLGKLYQGGVTRGGHSIGLAQCAEIIATACGLRSPEEAVQRGYIGATVRDHRYTAWFHWPTYTPTDR
ncbi:MAG: ATP-binding protein [Nannocystis sp.]|nr:ATP-binding protein [Nannocystis sp.]